jgi:hypothetical protein
MSLGAGNPIAASSGNQANTAASVTLRGPSSALGQHTAFIAGFNVTGGGATAGSIVLVTVTGAVGGTQTYSLTVPTGVTTGIEPLDVVFDPPSPEATPGGGITVSLPALGSRNTNACVNAWGFTR